MYSRPTVFWWIMAFLFLNFAMYSWFMYWQNVWAVVEEPSFWNVNYLLLIIILHVIKLMAIILLWSRQRIVYYLQITSMLAAVVGWLLVISYVPKEHEILLMGNMVGYTICLGAWLSPNIKRLYDILYRNVD